MATDRLTSTPPSQAGQRVSNHVYHVQFSSIVRSGSERSERNRCYHCIFCGLSIRRPVLRGSTPLWGLSCPRRIYNTPQKFMPKILDLSTVVHKLKQPFIRQNMLEHIIKYLRWNSTNMCSCGECSTDCCSISNTCSEYFCF